MMVIRGAVVASPTPDNAARTFVNIGGRVWAPDSNAQTAFAGRRYVSLTTTAGTITQFQARDSSGNLVNFPTAVRDAAPTHLHFDNNNNLILDNTFAIANHFNEGDRIVFAASRLSYVPALEEFVIYPADRCTWRTTYQPTHGYQVYDATFFGLGTSGTSITSPSLGYIGKSGRFVEIAG